MNPKKIRFSLILFLICMVGMGCNNHGSIDLNTTANYAPALVVSDTYANPVMTYTKTRIPSKTPTPTTTDTPSSTIPPTIVWTPLATLSLGEADQKIQTLLNNNAGCQLPCWWGITPGETSKIDTIRYLSSFTALTTVWGPPGNYQIGFVEPGSPIDDILSSYKIFGDYGNIEYYFQDELVYTISAYHGGGTGDKKVTTFQLSRILADYGVPDEMAVSAAPTAPGGPVFDIYLLYGQKGIYVHYTYYNVNISGNDIRVCPQNNGPEELLLWSPKTQALSLADFFAPSNWPTVQQALGMDIQSFQELFKNPNDGVCIKTSVDTWSEHPTSTP
jgi:hypothetical protein